MSLFYDFEKWTIISLASVAISLTVGLVLQYTHGFVDGNNNSKDDVQEYYETYPKDYSLSQNRQNLSETSCMSNTIVWIHNGICYAEDPEGLLK
jgi:hypothetical protein